MIRKIAAVNVKYTDAPRVIENLSHVAWNDATNRVRAAVAVNDVRTLRDLYRNFRAFSQCKHNPIANVHADIAQYVQAAGQTLTGIV